MQLLKYVKRFLFVLTFGFTLCLIFFKFSDKLKNRGFKAYNFTNLVPKISESISQSSLTPPIEIHPPYVITRIGNGLGNQLFKVAGAYALARRLNLPLFILTEEKSLEISHNLRNPDYRGYALGAFELASPEIQIKVLPGYDWNKIMRTARRTGYYCINVLFDRLKKTVTEKDMLHFGGFCHSEKYFEDYATEVKNLFQVSETYLKSTSKQFRNWTKEIVHKRGRNSTTSTIHIRRGDYFEINKRDTWPTPFSFYTEAISKMVENFCNKTVTFYIFTDHVSYVKRYFKPSYEPTESGREKNCTNYPEFIYVSQEYKGVGDEDSLTSVEEFLLMTLCRNIIISNSSFSWWAAYLISNVKKIVIGPAFHPDFFKHEENNLNRRFRSFMLAFKYPNTWITIDPYNGTGL